MSPPGRPKGEYRGAEHGGAPVTPSGRPKGESRSAQREGTPAKPPVLVLPGATLGVMGGGQLGRMFVHAAQCMGYFTAVLDPDPGSPAGRVSHEHVQADYLDEIGLAKLCGHSDAITTEFENVPADALARLSEHRPVSPGAAAVAIAQDRAEEKAHFARCGVACAPHAVIANEEDLAAVADDLLPGILKTARLGYDGKGQVRVATRAELRAAWESLRRTACVLERMLPLAFECSVLVARGRDGAMVHLPVQRNLHRNGILAVTEVHEGCVAPAQAQQAIAAARRIADGLDYVGVLCVEFFGLADGSLVVNEMERRGRTTAATGAWMRRTSRSSNCRCARWLACRWCRRASTVRRSCSTCWASCGFATGSKRPRRPTGPPCSPCPAPTCTCTASSMPGPAARWAT